MTSTISPEILQPIFDKVATHFLSMPHPSMNSDKVLCLYRDPDSGNRCFIGALIQDEDYDPKIEGRAIRGYDSTLETAVVRGLNALGIEIEELGDDLRDTLNHLQVIHDYWGEAKYGREGVTSRLVEFAEARKLSTAALIGEAQ